MDENLLDFIDILTLSLCHYQIASAKNGFFEATAHPWLWHDGAREKFAIERNVWLERWAIIEIYDESSELFVNGGRMEALRWEPHVKRLCCWRCCRSKWEKQWSKFNLRKAKSCKFNCRVAETTEAFRCEGIDFVIVIEITSSNMKVLEKMNWNN